MTENIADTRTAQPHAQNRATEDGPDAATGPKNVAAAHETLSPADIAAIKNLVTEDDTPVDNLFSEKQRRLLTSPFNVNWQGPDEGRPFLVAADVGVFRTPQEPPLVPDVFLSLDVTRPADWWQKEGRSYFIWHYQKAPDVVIEIVSNAEGGETGTKFDRYALFGVPYYVIFDPQKEVQTDLLRAYERTSKGVYVDCSASYFPGVGLGLQLWTGEFEGDEATWLRWQDASGARIQTGAEKAEQESKRADRLAAQLRSLGVTPDNGDSPLK